ncbi:aldo/keto reductase [Sphingomonas abietis]|uniref:Aldo/keto reductase n=1 Tax=Sphingomonas abietis TaxID=3012344 RepID=A0ABY7NQ52_9SPHN|nr:aldo/keto reductase [Sphingomonas abietis]WBO23090.1 aldo/keto reductase [Sphingomonas abietis]
MDITHAPIEQAVVRLSDGHIMPQLGYGTWQVTDGTADLVADAIRAGYRSIDTAAIYKNEREVGQGIADSGIARDQLFVTTKLWNDDQGFDSALAACEASLDRLGLDHVDLYLMHWPVPAQDRYVESWKAMIQLREQGKVRSIGVSNFLPDHLDRIIGETGVVPVLNQIELHPRFQQRDVRDYHAAKDILIESWSPLGRGGVLDHPTIEAIAKKHGRAPAQVVIRWHLDQGLITIPKASDRRHMVDNLAVGGFGLDGEDMAAIAKIDAADGRTGPDPATFGAG